MKIFELKQRLNNTLKKRAKRIKQISRKDLFKQVQIEAIWLFLYIISVSIFLWCRIAFHLGVNHERKKSTTRITNTASNSTKKRSMIRT